MYRIISSHSHRRNPPAYTTARCGEKESGDMSAGVFLPMSQENKYTPALQAARRHKMDLTQREQDTLDYIINTIMEKGYSPSVRDIKNALGYKSTSTVYNCLQKLENEGYIQKEEGKSRTIRVDNISAWTGTKVPIIGRVTAGIPVLAVENFDGYVSFIADSIGYSQNNLFALRVSGVSMIEAGIMDGDVVIVDKRDYAENGDIIVALLDDEATVKTFYRENGRFRLQPENRLLAPIYTDRVAILGKVVACMRIY